MTLAQAIKKAAGKADHLKTFEDMKNPHPELLAFAHRAHGDETGFLPRQLRRPTRVQ